VYELTSSYAVPRTEAISTARLVGQVMFLVAIAIGFLALGSYIGRDMSQGTARICSFAGIGMLFGQAFVPKLRYGAVGMAWLFVLALLIGLGLGPVIAYASEVDPAALTQAAGGTALTVGAMGALGFALSKDLAPWMRPLSFIMLGLFSISILALIFGGLGSMSPLFSLIVFGISALFIMVDFNYLRKHATEDDTVWLATGIFVSIVNIFISLLNLFTN
jgi:modulator of FtsH protease